jgi:hypothetical protein
MIEVLEHTDANITEISSVRGRKEEIVDSWREERDRYREYLSRMKENVNRWFWVGERSLYFDRDVTQMFLGVVEQQFCDIILDQQNQIRLQPRMEYWDFVRKGPQDGYYVLKKKARDSMLSGSELCAVTIDRKGNLHYKSESCSENWKWSPGSRNVDPPTLTVEAGHTFIAEQFCHVTKSENGKIIYEPDPKYWTEVQDNPGVRQYRLNDRARGLLGKGARKIQDSDILPAPAIVSFFPVFGQIPDNEQAFQMIKQALNPWMWWPIDGIPFPSQPMKVLGKNGTYASNPEFNPNLYWRGPTWMSSDKPVIDGFHSYGYQMIYTYIVQRTIGTLQDGRAVEHWDPVNGSVNTNNTDFPWAASCLAGSIWDELSDQDKEEFLRITKQPQ